MEIRRLPAEEVTLIGSIDRSEEITVGYSVESGQLVDREVDWVVPAWSPTGTGEHTIAGHIEQWRPVLERGAVLLGAFEDEAVLGLAIVEPDFEEGTAWLAFMHVGRPHRRRGVATALWDEALRIARRGNARTLYISATPSESAVGFYLSKGCRLASPPHPGLFAQEPEDIHLTQSLR